LKQTETSWKPLLVTIILANVLWFATFYLTFSTFWIKITISASSLTALSWWIRPISKERFHIDARALLLGFISAVALYLVFWAGKEISSAIFPFAERQIGGIYGKGGGTPMWAIFLMLFFITGPCEELYWRGFLQDRLMELSGVQGLAPHYRRLCRCSYMVIQFYAYRRSRRCRSLLGRHVLAHRQSVACHHLSLPLERLYICSNSAVLN